MPYNPDGSYRELSEQDILDALYSGCTHHQQLTLEVAFKTLERIGEGNIAKDHQNKRIQNCRNKLSEVFECENWEDFLAKQPKWAQHFETELEASLRNMAINDAYSRGRLGI